MYKLRLALVSCNTLLFEPLTHSIVNILSFTLISDHDLRTVYLTSQELIYQVYFLLVSYGYVRSVLSWFL